MKINWNRVLILLGIWAVAGTLLGIEVVFNLRVVDPSISFLDAVVPQYQRAALWVIMVPLVLWLRRRVPLSTGAWAGGIAFHLAISASVMTAYYLGRVVYLVVIGEFAWADFWAAADKNFWGRNVIDMVYYWLVIAWGYWEELRQRYRQEELKAAQLESKLTQAELQVLKRQLHPHFLFNTMNTISVLVREGRNAEAVRLISKLSTLLRMSLDSDRASEVSLGQELDFLGHYVDLQKARFPDRLDYRVTVSSEAEQARIPNLLLQPLVENAILHGIASKAGPGLVEVWAEIEDKRLCIRVLDDGRGFDPSGAKLGVGLTNTKERLSRLYGEASHFEIVSSPGKGTCITLEIPCST
jgi:signal transduction histidine kinase